jgi:Zn(2)-Cys(6) binuclear cluster domain-containing protein
MFVNLGGVFTSRSRKIRCDSTRPNCQNCVKRGNECVYDKVPKRRGPDKRPGTRKRSCKKRQSDGSEPQPKKKQRADPVNQGTTTHAGYNQYEISPVAVPVFGSAQQKSSKVDIEPPAASSSLADATGSYHEAYYVRVSSTPLIPSRFAFRHPPNCMDPPDSPKRLPSPTSTQPASTSHTSKTEIQSGQPFSHHFESDFRSPEPSYEDLSPPLADAPTIQSSHSGWWEDLLDIYAPTREQAYVMHTSTSTERLT